MKKINKLFVLAIASMAAFASCQKAGEIENNFQPKVLKAVFEDGLSKTALAENFQIQWSESDAITGFDLDGTNHTSTSTAVSENKLEAAFTFKDLTIEDDLLLVMYPADSKASINNTAVISTTLPEVQNAVAGSFDPKANLALAEGGEENVKFLNGGALLAFDIKNDNIVKIELEAGSYENFAGPATLNFDADNMPLLQSTYASDLHKVTLQGNFEKGKTYYAVVFPSEYSSLKMVFTRNDGKTATYTNSNSLSVARNSITTIWKGEIADSKWEGGATKHDASMAAGNNGSDAVVKVNEEDRTAIKVGTSKAGGDMTITVGAGATSLSFYAAAWKGSNSTTIEITPSENIESSSLELTADNGITSNSPFTLSGNESDYLFTLALSNISESTTFTLSSSARFVVWGATYIGGAGPTPEPTLYNVNCATVTGGSISADPAKAAEGATITLTATPDTGYEFVSWAVTNASTSAAITVTDNKFTMPASNVNVSATFKEKEGESLKTMDEIFAAATAAGATATDAKVTFNNWVVSAVRGTNNAYVTDGIKGLIIYASGHGFTVGDVLSGTVNCKVQLYNGASELTSLTSSTTGLTVTKGGVITPAAIAIADLGGVNTGAVITFAELTYNGSVFTDGTNTITPYNTFITLPTLVNGKKYSVTGVYIQYRDTKEIAPRTADDIVEKAAPKYAVSVASGIANGTVTVDFSEATEGQTVTITATPASGYKVKSVSAKKTASGTALTVTNNKFTMPAEAVTVSAEFEEYGSGGSWIAATLIAGTNASAAKVNGIDAIKVGTSKAGGDMSIKVAAGATKVRFYAAAWNGVTGLSLNITPAANVETTSVALTADTGVAGNSPFTLSGTESSYMFEINLKDITAETTLKLTSSAAKRFVVWGAEYYK